MSIRKYANRIVLISLCMSMSLTSFAELSWAETTTDATPVGIAEVLDKTTAAEEEEVLYEAPLPAVTFLVNKALTLGGDKAIAIEKQEIAQTDGKDKPTAPAEDPPVIKSLQQRRKAGSIYNKIAIAKVTSFVNIRDKASEDGKVLGKIYNNCAATIIDSTLQKDGKWYKIKSGKVSGYIKAKYFIVGEEAKELALSVGYVNAKVKVNSLRLRKSPDLGSPTLTVLSKGSVYAVESEGAEFSKISIDGDMVGYVQNDYIEIGINYKEAISIEEEAEQLRLAREAEEKARKLAEEESRKAAEKTKKKNTTAKKTTTASSKKTSSAKKTTAEPREEGGSSAKRDAIVAYALQYVGVLNYVLGGDSLKTGTDCSGFVQIIYGKFGIKLPRVSDEQGKCGKAVSSSEMRPGDLIYYGGHIGIYIGDGKVCHCSTAKTWPNTKVSTWNYRSVKSIRNVIGD